MACNVGFSMLQDWRLTLQPSKWRATNSSHKCQLQRWHLYPFSITYTNSRILNEVSAMWSGHNTTEIENKSYLFNLPCSKQPLSEGGVRCSFKLSPSSTGCAYFETGVTTLIYPLLMYNKSSMMWSGVEICVGKLCKRFKPQDLKILIESEFTLMDMLLILQYDFFKFLWH